MLECAILYPGRQPRSSGGNKLPGAWGTLSLVAPAVERASRSYNFGVLSLGQAFDLASTYLVPPTQPPCNQNPKVRPTYPHFNLKSL